jgi:hypothetical protein
VEILGAAILVASVVTLNFLKSRNVVVVPHERLVIPGSAA